jgi:hypothetical protein
VPSKPAPPRKPLRKRAAKRVLAARARQGYDIWVEAGLQPDAWVKFGPVDSISTENVDMGGGNMNVVYTMVLRPGIGAAGGGNNRGPVMAGDSVFAQMLARSMAPVSNMYLWVDCWYKGKWVTKLGPAEYLADGTFRYINTVVIIPEGVDYIQPQIEVVYDGPDQGQMWANFDEVLLRVTPPPTPLPPLEAIGNASIEILGPIHENVVNGNFAHGMEGWPAYVGPPGSTGMDDPTVGTFVRFAGDGTTNEVFAMQTIPVEEGVTYNLSCWLYGTGWDNHPTVMQVDARNAAKEIVDMRGVFAFNVLTFGQVAGAWAQFSGKYTVPVGWGVVSLTPRIGIAHTDGSVVTAAMVAYISKISAKSVPEWVDVTPQSMVIKLGWGADDPAGLLTVPAAGGWDVQTYDPKRVLDPANGASPNAAFLRPGRAMRIGVRTPTGFEVIRQGLIDEVRHDVYSKTGSLRGTDIVPLIVAAKIPALAAPDPLLPLTLRARAQYLIDKAGLHNLVPVESGKINGIVNGDFEANPSALGWRWDGGGSFFPEPQPQGTLPFEGGAIRANLNVPGPDVGNYPSLWSATPMPVIPGQSYTLDAWHSAVGTQRMRSQRIEWLDGNQQNPSGLMHEHLLTDPTDGVWRRYTDTYVAPEGAVFAVVRLFVYEINIPPQDHYALWDNVSLIGPDPTLLIDPPVGPLPFDQDVSVWSAIGTSAYDALHAMWIDRFGMLRFRSFGTPRDHGFQIGGNNGIPISTLETNASMQNIYTVVRAFDQDAPDVPIIKTNPIAIEVYGSIPLTREKPVPDADFWATNVLNDRSGSALQYKTGTLYPRTPDELRALIELEMIDTAHIVADDIIPPLDLTARVLGGRLIADTDVGWTAEVLSYIPASEWVDQEVPPIVPPEPPVTTHQETRYYNANKDTRAARDSNGTALGSGTEGELPVGAWSGWRNRSFIGFASIPWTKVVSVDKCILELDTSSQVNIGFGSSPKVIVARVTQSWNEGSSSSPSGSNSTKYPGPSATSTHQVTKSVTRSENAAVSIDITAIARDWMNGSAQYGVRLISSGEDSTTYTTEFWSRENSSSGRRPRLVLTVTVED